MVSKKEVFWVERWRDSDQIVLIVRGSDKNNWTSVAEVFGVYDRKKKTYSYPDAFLLAAAPELFELVKILVDVTTNSVDPDSFAEIRNMALSVLAKARGAS